jgi:hypothetical protein
MSQARIIIDKKFQPPTAQTGEPTNEDDVLQKGLKRDHNLLHSTSNDLDSLTDVVDVVDTNQPDDEVDNDTEDTEEIQVPEISDAEWLARSRQAYDGSTSYFDNNVRGDLDNNIRAFHNQHKTSSHLAAAAPGFTSRVYRPKTRSVLMKYEAAADTAYFSNPDVVSIEAENPSDHNEILAAACVKSLLQYRLTKTIPWYQIVIGGFQDAQVQGLAIAHYYWKIRKESDVAPNDPTFIEDKPAIDLIPLENFRFDANANWIDVVESSPFLIYLRPMFLSDIKQQIKTGYFKYASTEDLLAGNSNDGESTRITRNQTGQDPRNNQAKEISDYEVVVVQEHIHRINGEDYVWYTVNNQILLKDPVPISEIYFTGRRQFVVGQTIIETHNPYSCGVPELVSGIQEEINEIANQRLNNVKLALNKKFIVKTDSEADLSALLRNQPGSAVFTQDPTNDIKEIKTEDVTQSSYLEQDRLNADFDELISNFNPQSIQSQPAGGADTWRGMQMLNSNASVVLEHQLRIFTQTFIEPLLRGLIRLEFHYETDDTVFALIGKQQGNILQKFGQDKMTQDMLKHDLVVKVNVGMGATDPIVRTGKLISAISTIEKLMSSPMSKAFDIKEITKELFANAGYGDGMRFINQEQDPNLVQLMQENAALKQKLAKSETQAMAGIQRGREANQTKLAIATMKEKNLNAKFMAEKAFTISSQPVQSSAPAPQAKPNPIK